MKACFLLQRRFAYVGHAMALTFKKKYGINEFCGYVYMRSSLNFLKNQKDIKYTKLLLDEDIQKEYKNEQIDLKFLNYLKKEYGMPNLWPYIELDRVIRYNLLLREYPHNTPSYTHEEMIKILQVKARAIIKFIEEEKPDFIVFSAIAGIGSLLLYQIAKKKNIKTFIISEARIDTRCSITENIGHFSYVDKTLNNIQADHAPYQKYIQQAENFLNKFRDKPAPQTIIDSPNARPINRARQFSFLLPHKLLHSISWFIWMLYDYFLNKHHNDFLMVKPHHYLWDRVKRKTRVLIGFDKFYDQVDLNEDFAFFPLQYDPEISSLLFAPFYTDQLWVVKQIARSLPIHYKLYVKEHPAMFGYRPHCFYKELKKIPNVKIINPSTISFPLIQKAKIILSLTGTAGWEGVLLKKPAITFGDVFYNKLPMVKKCKAIEDLPLLIKEQLENFNYNEKILVDFIAAIYKESADVNLVQLWDIDGAGKMNKKEKELESLVSFIGQKLHLEPLKRNTQGGNG